ncbi:tyrosine recombinase XerC [Acrocarpospora macrocephala]|uniref:Tyrosine recombinase XerC n=1 Tax=Acrocarpospora macrocephala TaxID=150177 RepID=A0A5M3WJY9_9ACTN|nr:tyrosine-type recombinase/integrase [Acrocarpospora macrocephala]GES07363.1 tyrosine recombinase XerC [Acrocarpospora macrocephala]
MSATVTPISRGRRRTSAPKNKPLRPQGAPLPGLIESWQISLDAASKSDKTIRSYTDTARAFHRWARKNNVPDDAENIEAPHIRRFLIAERERTSAATAATHFRNLRVFFNWLIREKERTWESPVMAADAPNVPNKVRKYLTDDDLTALLKACAGNDFESRRDTAIIRIFMDNGVRVSGLANILTEDLDLKGRKIKIRLKGGDEFWAPIGVKAVHAIDRYLRIRAAHPKAGRSPWLWLGVQGRGTSHLGHSGVRAMLRRRGEEAEIEKVTPHRFRGSVTHQLLAAGANDGDVQQILGWRSREMVYRYAGELAADRARETHARLSPGDRI